MRNIRAALQGHKVSVPMWFSVLQVAERWGVPPWQIADRTPMYWMRRLAIVDRQRQIIEQHNG